MLEGTLASPNVFMLIVYILSQVTLTTYKIKSTKSNDAISELVRQEDGRFLIDVGSYPDTFLVFCPPTHKDLREIIRCAAESVHSTGLKVIYHH